MRMYSVFKNLKHGTYSIISHRAMDYPFMVRSDDYTELYTGWYSQCSVWLEKNREPSPVKELPAQNLVQDGLG